MELAEDFLINMTESKLSEWRESFDSAPGGNNQKIVPMIHDTDDTDGNSAKGQVKFSPKNRIN